MSALLTTQLNNVVVVTTLEEVAVMGQYDTEFIPGNYITSYEHRQTFADGHSFDPSEGPRLHWFDAYLKVCRIHGAWVGRGKRVGRDLTDDEINGQHTEYHMEGLGM